MNTEEIYRYLYEYRITLSSDHWSHRIISSKMDIFDETEFVIKARPEDCPKLFTFYKKDVNPVAEKEIGVILPTAIAQMVDRRNDIYSRTFCIYVMSCESDRLKEFEFYIGEIVTEALKNLRLFGAKRPKSGNGNPSNNDV